MLHLFDNKPQNCCKNSHILKGLVSPKPIILFEWALFLTVAQTEKCFGWFSRSYRYFSIHVFIIFDVPTGWDESWWTLSTFAPKQAKSFWSSKLENSSHFSIFPSSVFLRSILDSRVPAPLHPPLYPSRPEWFLLTKLHQRHLPQVHGTSMRWDFHSKWVLPRNQQKQANHYCRYDGLWPSFPQGSQLVLRPWHTLDTLRFIPDHHVLSVAK